MNNKIKKIKKIIITLIAMIMLVVICKPVFADVGGVQRYDGSTSKRNSSASSTRSPSSSTSSSSSNGLIGIVFSPFGLILIVAIGGGLFYWGKKKGIVNDFSDITKMGEVAKQFKSELNLGDLGIKTSEETINQIREIDPMFSEENFLNWAKDVFVKLQNAWTKKDWKIIRPFESNQLFELHSAQLQEFINNNTTNVIERISVKNAKIKNFKQDGDKEVLKVRLDAIMIDYIIDDKSRRIIKGSNTEDQYMSYSLTFMRKAGIKTEEGKSNKSTTNCPNCGAPTQITSAGQCDYCGSVITTGEHDWVLTSLEGA